MVPHEKKESAYSFLNGSFFDGPVLAAMQTSHSLLQFFLKLWIILAGMESASWHGKERRDRISHLNYIKRVTY